MTTEDTHLSRTVSPDPVPQAPCGEVATWQGGQSTSLSPLSVEIFLLSLNDVKGDVWMPLVAAVEEECFPWPVIRFQQR